MPTAAGAATAVVAAALRAPTIAVFAGSSRQGSVNVKLARAAETAAANLGARTAFVDLESYHLPLYSQDLESRTGMPSSALELKRDLGQADGWILASPEYNGFVTVRYTFCATAVPCPVWTNALSRLLGDILR